ncbi:MAG: SH3 domain-containing protein [Candidatus Promineifilaceae bacterium]|nr:SH3 domain-containing protein [Candidatus Promineifilaceae bacterium]
MARFRKPDDPRESAPPARRLPGDRDGVPWVPLGLGIVVTVIGVAMALVLVGALLQPDPLAVAVPTPTIIHLTAPPTNSPTPTTFAPTSTPIPTFTPAPTRDLATAPEDITVGYYARVAGTGNAGLSLRPEPAAESARMVVDEGTLMSVIGGPEEGGEYIWWQVRLLDGVEGWVAGQFLAPAAAPDAP